MLSKNIVIYHYRVSDESRARLLHVKGKRRVRVSEVPLKWESFNSGDSFIADIDKDFFVWNGRACNKMERIQVIYSLHAT